LVVNESIQKSNASFLVFGRVAAVHLAALDDLPQVAERQLGFADPGDNHTGIERRSGLRLRTRKLA
jgi:hypothetical protein